MLGTHQGLRGASLALPCAPTPQPLARTGGYSARPGAKMCVGVVGLSLALQGPHSGLSFLTEAVIATELLNQARKQHGIRFDVE